MIYIFSLIIFLSCDERGIDELVQEEAPKQRQQAGQAMRDVLLNKPLKKPLRNRQGRIKYEGHPRFGDPAQ